MKLDRKTKRILIQDLAIHQCTDEEIAELADVPLDKLQRLFGEECRLGRALGRQQLREKLYKLASAEGVPGQANLLVWLSKQYLGMKEKVETEGKLKIEIEMIDYSKA